MFVAGEDSYFLAYTALLLLTELKCKTAARPFVEPAKIAYLADFIANEPDLVLATGDRIAVDRYARSRLSLLHDRAIARRAPLERLIDAIARRELVGVERVAGEASRIYLLPDATVEQLVESWLYEGERAHIRALRAFVPRLRTMTLATLKDRLFGRHGVRTWDD